MDDYFEFLEKRREGIGGSDVAAILGVSNFKKTAVDIWKEKIGEIKYIKPNPCDKKTASRYWGQVLEKAIINAYSEEKNVNVTFGKRYGQIKHKEYPWLIANIDGIAHTETGDILIEAKNWDNDPEERWGKEGTDQIPMDYIFQVNHYLYVTGLKKADIAVRLKGRLAFYEFEKNDILIKQIHQELNDFWFENVKKKIPPEPKILRDVKSLYPHSKSEKKYATEDVFQYVNKARLIKNEISNKEKDLEKLKTNISKYMEDFDTLMYGNDKVVTFKQNKNGVRSFKLL